MKRYSFSLAEVTTVLILILTLLGIILKSTDLLKSKSLSRDAQRIAQIDRLAKTLHLILMENPKIFIGSSSIVYVSLPAKSATTNCQVDYPNLPDLPSGWQYYCAPKDNYTKTDGSGWLPINFYNLPQIKLETLPIDPLNNEQNFFAYVADNNKKEFEFLVIPESSSNKGPNSISSQDGGTSYYLYEAGNNKALIPEEIELALGIPSGELVWSRNENFDIYYDDIKAIYLDNDYIYLVGSHEVDHQYVNWQWVIEKRNKKTGEIVWATITDPTPGNYRSEAPWDMISDDNFIYIVGRNGNYVSYIEKRDKNTGELITATTSSAMESAWRVTQDNENLYITGWNRNVVYLTLPNGNRMGTSDYYLVVEKRRKLDLGLIWRYSVNPSSPYINCPSPNAPAYQCLCYDGDVYPTIEYKNGAIYLGTGQGTFSYYTTCSGIIGRIEKINANNGSRVSFVTTTNRVNDLYADDNYLFVSTYGNLEKRDFNLNLLLSTQANASILDSFGKYIYLAYNSSVSGRDIQWVIEKRKKEDLSLIWIKFSNPSNREDYVKSIKVDSTGIYLGGYDYNTTGGYYDAQLRLEKRAK